MVLAPDLGLVALREHLSAARADGAPFAQAWERARAELLADLSRDERKSWSVALAATRPAWRAAYYGSSGRVDCVTELEAFALDGELEPLRYEPVVESQIARGGPQPRLPAWLRCPRPA